jgi:hypothetical protein
MRLASLLLAATLAACAMPGNAGREFARDTLTPADASTNLIADGPLVFVLSTPGQTDEGMDPVVTLTLTRADGRTMIFQEANHTEYDLRAQSEGGPLAQAMGLMAGNERPTLYHHVQQDASGVPFLCGPEGPLSVGVYKAEDGAVTMVGLKQTFEFETLADGSVAALPMSPDQICARLRFTSAG